MTTRYIRRTIKYVINFTRMTSIEKTSRLLLRSWHFPSRCRHEQVISHSKVPSLASSFVQWYGTQTKTSSKEKKKKKNAKGKKQKKESSGEQPPPNILGYSSLDREENQPLVGKPLSATFTYEGPFSNAVKKVKHLSLFSCFVTLSSCPVMLLLDPATLVEGAAATSMTARMSLAATLSTFGLGTTGLLHWFTYPYIHRLSCDGKELDIETTTFLAKKKVDRIPLKEIQAGAPGSMHPLSTFQAFGRVYYIDKEYFYDKQLRSILAGDDPDDNPEKKRDP